MTPRSWSSPSFDSGDDDAARVLLTSFTVDATDDAVATVRRRITTFLDDHRVGADARGDVEVLISEVVGNFLRHESPKTVEVEIAVDDHHGIVVAVLGGPHDASYELAHPVVRTATWADHGRGLTILDSLAHAWGTRRQHRRTAVWFAVRDLDPAGGDGTSSTTDRAPGSVDTQTVCAAADLAYADTSDLAAQRTVSITRDAVNEAARRAATAAETAREATSRHASEAALAIADAAERAVIAARLRTDGIAAGIASDAAAAAALVRNSLPGGGDSATAAVAYGIAAAVTAAAAAAADQADDAAALVAKAVATAAAAVAATTNADVIATELRVRAAATALQAAAADTAGQLAADAVIQRGLANIARRQQ